MCFSISQAQFQPNIIKRNQTSLKYFSVCRKIGIISKYIPRSHTKFQIYFICARNVFFAV